MYARLCLYLECPLLLASNILDLPWAMWVNMHYTKKKECGTRVLSNITWILHDFYVYEIRTSRCIGEYRKETETGSRPSMVIVPSVLEIVLTLSLTL